MKKYIKIIVLVGFIGNLGLFSIQEIAPQQLRQVEQPGYWQRFKGTVGHYMPDSFYAPAVMAGTVGPALVGSAVKTMADWDNQQPATVIRKGLFSPSRAVQAIISGLNDNWHYGRFVGMRDSGHMVAATVPYLLAGGYGLKKLYNYLEGIKDIGNTNYLYYAPGTLAMLAPYYASYLVPLLGNNSYGVDEDRLAGMGNLLGPAIFGAGHLAHQYFNRPAVVLQETETPQLQPHINVGQ